MVLYQQFFTIDFMTILPLRPSHVRKKGTFFALLLMETPMGTVDRREYQLASPLGGAKTD